MTLQEFSVEFDILYDNISSNQAPGLTEYEKSVFLTQAQEALILDLYKGNMGDSFETTEEVTRYLNSLVKTQPVSQLDNTPHMLNMKCCNIPITDDVWLITYQAGSINVNNKLRDVIVVPTRQDSLYRDLNNPFRGPNNNRILATSEDKKIILYSKYDVLKFYYKYIERPYPIILEGALDDLSNVTIEKQTESKELDWLPESTHRQILIRAIQMAKAVWQS